MLDKVLDANATGHSDSSGSLCKMTAPMPYADASAVNTIGIWGRSEPKLVPLPTASFLIEKPSRRLQTTTRLAPYVGGDEADARWLTDSLEIWHNS